MRRYAILVTFLILTSVCAQTIFAEDITITANATWTSGTYTYENVQVTNGAVLIFNGAVTLNARTLTIDSGSSISANYKGYPANEGPGAGIIYSGGGGYGGKGGGLTGGPTYGSAKFPVDLGSGGGNGYGGSAPEYGRGGAGGGAIRLNILDTLTLNGSISANGYSTLLGDGGAGSGGSIYITTINLAGTGQISANGGANAVTGGGGGRIAVYYSASTFPETHITANGGTNAESGTIVFEVQSLDVPAGTFKLIEKTSTVHTLSGEFISQENVLSDIAVSGDLSGTFNSADLEIVRINNGSFSGSGFFKGGFDLQLEGFAYKGQYQGIVYFVAAEQKFYLKGKISGDISGVIDGSLSETVPGSGTYDKYAATWSLNRLNTELISASINVAGTLSEQSSHTFSSELYLYQANMEGASNGSYSGPLSAVVTHVRINSANEYQGEGFSIISYNCSLGQGQAYSYNQLTSPGKVEFLGLVESPLSGELCAFLDESKSPRTLSGTIERLDFGLEPMADFEVITWGPQRVSPGQTVDYIIEARNDGLISAENTAVIFSLDPQLEYVSSTYSYFNEETNEIIMDLGELEAKGKKIIRVTSIVPWGLPVHTYLENECRISTTTKERKLQEVDAVSWRTDIQPGDIVLERNTKSPVFIISPGSYWTHSGGIVYGDKDESWTGGREGYFVIEALPNNYHANINHGGVKATPVRSWDYPLKKEVLVLRVGGLTTEQKNYITHFWKKQIGKPYQCWYLSPPNSNIDDTQRYCSELVWAPYYNLGIDFDSEEDYPAISPQEIYDSDFTSSVPGGYYNYQNLNVNIGTNSSEVITAHDPNEKLVSPEGDVLPGSKLNYTINYENEGEGIAYGVYITDTLDEDLDDTTRVVNNGGSYDSNTRTLTWLIGEVQSKQKGSVTFTVNIKADAQDNSEAINYATVHFPSVPEITKTNGVVNTVTTYVDNVPPTTTTTISPNPNDNGWNNNDVEVVLSASDNEGGLGVAKIEYSFDAANWITYSNPVTITTEGMSTVYYKSTDNANNVESQKSLEVKIDKTPPLITAQASPQPNANNWNNIAVTVSFGASDNLSGIYSITQPITVSTEGMNQQVGGEAFDLAGNSVTANVSLNIDLTSPVVTIGTPVQGAEYLLNANIPTVWSAADALSGIAEATGTVPNGSPVNTATVGQKNFSVVALDKAGNRKELTLTYNVRYSFGGILPPINPDGSSIFKLGRVVPVKFQLKDASGNYIATAVARIYLSKVSNNVSGTEIEAESPGQANSGNLFRYDATDNQYIFNLGTSNLSQGTWQIKIQLDDGSAKYVNVSFK